MKSKTYSKDLGIDLRSKKRVRCPFGISAIVKKIRP